VNSLAQKVSNVNTFIDFGHEYLGYINNMTIIDNTKFVDWLNEQLDQREWSRGRLARMGHISPSMLAYIYSNKKRVGLDTGKKIAKALGLPEAMVFEKAGLTTQKSKETPSFDELKFLFEQMDAEDQSEFLAIGRLKIKREDPQNRGKAARL